MKIFGKPWFLPILITILLLVGGGIFILTMTEKEDEISHEGMRSRIEQMYGGTVFNIIQENGRYKAFLKRGDGDYQVLAERMNGDIISITLLENETLPEATVKSQEEIKAIITEKYKGTLERIVLNSQKKPPVYMVEMSKDEKLFALSIDAVTGNVLDTTEKQMTTDLALLSKEQAIDRAKTQLNGEVEYITYEETAEGGYYLIEIETDNDQEAVIQVHGVTGEILTVTWDDHNDDKDASDKD